MGWSGVAVLTLLTGEGGSDFLAGAGMGGSGVLELKTAPVEEHRLQRLGFDTLQAAYVYGRHRPFFRILAEGDRRAAADRAEMMLDHVPVERVGRHILLRRQQARLFARHEPQQRALAAA